MAIYPDGIKSWTNVADNTDHVMAAHINEAYEEIIALEENAAKQSQLSNPNLLINPFFQVNQRGQSSYSEYGYAADAWRCVNDRSLLTINPSGGVTLSAVGAPAYFGNFMEYPISELENKQATLTVILGNGTILTKTGIISGEADSRSLEIYFDIGSVRLIRSGDVYDFNISLSDGNSIDIKAAKLELGEVSTLANDVPDIYEIDKCKRYFRLWKTEAARTAALNEVGLMRLESPTLGTIVIGGTTYYTASAEL